MATAQLRVGGVGERDGQAEAIEQLRTQLAFLRVHRAHQHEARGVLVRDAVALDHVDAAGGGVEQRIDQRIGQQVDLVDVQHALVRARQQAGRRRMRPSRSTPSRSSVPTTCSRLAPAAA